MDAFDEGYVTVPQCAARMAITQDRVLELVRRGVLRAKTTPFGQLVQPAIVSGAVE
jgi:hypothetical protein